MPTPLLKSQPPPTPTSLTPPSEQQALREFLLRHPLACNRRHRKPNTNPYSYPYNKHGPFSSHKLWYLPNHRDALKAHMHLLHKLGNAKTEANYHAYYQTLIKDGTANGATSNAYLTSSNVSFKTKCIILKYRTGTLYNQKHAVLFKLSKVKLAPSTHK